ncbi:MAG: histidine phosphatase family protein [Haloferacaceae archaeon]
MATVLLARHAESTWNRQGRLQGWAPTELTDRGRDQAAALAARLAARSPDRLLSSDLERTVETAEIVASETALDPALDRAWRERDYGFLQGLPADEAFERFPRLSPANDEAAPDERPEGGESIRTFTDRVTQGWDRLVAGLAPDETVVVVTHNGVLGVVLAHVEDRPLAERYETAAHPNCAVTEVSVRDAGTATVREAATDHLSPD